MILMFSVDTDQTACTVVEAYIVRKTQNLVLIRIRQLNDDFSDAAAHSRALAEVSLASEIREGGCSETPRPFAGYVMATPRALGTSIACRYSHMMLDGFPGSVGEALLREDKIDRQDMRPLLVRTARNWEKILGCMASSKQRLLSLPGTSPLI